MTNSKEMGAGGNLQADIVRVKIRNFIEKGVYDSVYSLEIPCSQTVADLFTMVSTKYQLDKSSIDLLYTQLQDSGEEQQINLSGKVTLRLTEVFRMVGRSCVNEVLLVPMESTEDSSTDDSINHPQISLDDIGEGSLLPVYGPPNAPPVPIGIVKNVTRELSGLTSPHFSSSSTSYDSGYKTETGYVGLVNQAMTCYMNSLFQTLYMTPEFRAALYHWKFKGSPEDAVKNIPYQLQKLFVLLQTSKERAVKTIDVTRSFGWDHSDVWLQHDIQELCRVMFDALETSFKDTPQSALINKLYQGKLLDFVRCLKCGNVRAREDTYLDIQLPIRPFGSSDSYSSVEESLRAFTRVERLEGSNQYHCESCNTKVDAEKGYTFRTFPYLLTLQLMRFAFDFNTLTRLKLNDCMTFPFTLDLNKFIDQPIKTETTDDINQSDVNDRAEGAVNDSGLNEDDIEVPDTSHINNKTPLSTGPYVYELFSVMVHSGSAVGGHYYAYIKSFDTNKWYCFNDQNVTAASEEDVQRTFGGYSSSGAPSLSFRSGSTSSIYTSSVNAYMLMYRRVDPLLNKSFITLDQCPQHVVQMIQDIQQEEDEAKRLRQVEQATCRIKVFCYLPNKDKITSTRLEVHKDTPLNTATDILYSKFELSGLVDRNDCRLIRFDEHFEAIHSSFDDVIDWSPMERVLGSVRNSYSFDLLLEIKRPNQPFVSYRHGGVTLRLSLVDLVKECVASPQSLHIPSTHTVPQIKEDIAKFFGVSPELAPHIQLVDQPRCSVDPLKLVNCLPPAAPYRDWSNRSVKVFLYLPTSGSLPSDESVNDFASSALFYFLNKYEQTIAITVQLPSPQQVADYERLQVEEDMEDAVENGDHEYMEISSTTTNDTLHPPPSGDLQEHAMQPLFSSPTSSLDNGGSTRDLLKCVPPPPSSCSSASLSKSITGVNPTPSVPAEDHAPTPDLMETSTDPQQTSGSSSECPTLVTSSCTGSQLSLEASADPHKLSNLRHHGYDLNDLNDDLDLHRGDTGSTRACGEDDEEDDYCRDNSSVAMETDWTPPGSPGRGGSLDGDGGEEGAAGGGPSQEWEEESDTMGPVHDMFDHGDFFKPAVERPLDLDLPAVSSCRNQRQKTGTDNLAFTEFSGQGTDITTWSTIEMPVSSSVPTNSLLSMHQPAQTTLHGAHNSADQSHYTSSSTNQNAPPDYNTAVLNEDAKRYCIFCDTMSTPEGEQYVKARVDKRMTLTGLKKRLESLLKLPSDHFKVYRVQGSQDIELTNCTEILSHLSNDAKFIVKLGRLLRRDEVRLKVYLFNLANWKVTDLILQSSGRRYETILQLKRRLSRQFMRRLGVDIPVDRMRLRRRQRMSPGLVLADSCRLENVDSFAFAGSPLELIAQLLPTSSTPNLHPHSPTREPVCPPDGDRLPMEPQSVHYVFLRRWWPSKLALDDNWLELAVPQGTKADQLVCRLETLVPDISRHLIQLAKPQNSVFPADMSVLDIHSTLDWFTPCPLPLIPTPETSSLSPVVALADVPIPRVGASYSILEATRLSRLTVHEDGLIIFFRNAGENLKDLSKDERRKLEESENTRLGRSNTNYSYSSSYGKKERALKIYTDSSVAK